MGKQWVRQEIKKNEIAGLLERATTWIQANRQRAMAVAGGALAVLAAAGLIVFRSVTMRNTAWEKLAIAESYAYRGQPSASLDQIKSLSSDFGGTKAAAFGQIFAADLMYRQGNYKDAAESYRRLSTQAPNELMPLALGGLGLSLEASGDFKGAVETNQRLLDSYQDHFLAPQAHASLARSLLALGHPEQAKPILDRMALLYPDSYWSSWAQSRLTPPPPSAIKKP